MKLLASLLLCFLASISICAQDEFIYGKPSDLKGLKKVYIDTGADLKSRNKITEKLTKEKLGLEFLDTIKEAEIVIFYEAGTERRVVGVPTPNGTLVGTPEYPYGAGAVLVDEKPKPKLVFSFQDQQNTAFERGPLTNFIRELVKLFKQNR